MARRPLIIDCDPGKDDAVAILLALAAPEAFDVQLISAAAGAMGATLVLAEGGPDYPDPGRMWRLCEAHGATHLGTAPTSIRTLMRHGPEEVERRDFAPDEPRTNSIGRMVDASEVAYLTVFLASDKSWAVTGELLIANGGAGNSVYY